MAAVQVWALALAIMGTGLAEGKLGETNLSYYPDLGACMTARHRALDTSPPGSSAVCLYRGTMTQAEFEQLKASQ